MAIFHWKIIGALENMKLEKLTKEEREYAEENHNLIYSFLHKRGYSIEEYYNVAVFGYLKAVQAYCRRDDLLPNYDFPYVAWQYMRAEISDYLKMKKAQKRRSMENNISLDAEKDDSENLYNAVGGKSAETDMMENIAVNELMKDMTDLQRKITHYKMDGFNNKEICIMLEIPSSSFYVEINRIKSVS